MIQLLVTFLITLVQISLGFEHQNVSLIKHLGNPFGEIQSFQATSRFPRQVEEGPTTQDLSINDKLKLFMKIDSQLVKRVEENETFVADTRVSTEAIRNTIEGLQNAYMQEMTEMEKQEADFQKRISEIQSLARIQYESTDQLLSQAMKELQLQNMKVFEMFTFDVKVAFSIAYGYIFTLLYPCTTFFGCQIQEENIGAKILTVESNINNITTILQTIDNAIPFGDLIDNNLGDQVKEINKLLENPEEQLTDDKYDEFVKKLQNMTNSYRFWLYYFSKLQQTPELSYQNTEITDEDISGMLDTLKNSAKESEIEAEKSLLQNKTDEIIEIFKKNFNRGRFQYMGQTHLLLDQIHFNLVEMVNEYWNETKDFFKERWNIIKPITNASTVIDIHAPIKNGTDDVAFNIHRLIPEIRKLYVRVPTIVLLILVCILLFLGLLGLIVLFYSICNRRQLKKMEERAKKQYNQNWVAHEYNEIRQDLPWTM